MESCIRRPILIIPACGKSQRFKDKGVMKPKGLIYFGLGKDGHSVGKTMIEHAIPTGYEDRTFVIVEDPMFSTFRTALPRHIGVHSIPHSTDQLMTLVKTCRMFAPDEVGGILVINCDNKFSDEKIAELVNIKENVGAIVFETDPNPAFGYVNDFPLFSHGAEKQPISRYAIGGAFYFSNTQMVIEAHQDLLASQHFDTSRAGGLYISHLFEFMHGPKRAILEDRKNIFDFGTPELLSSLLDCDITELTKEKE